MRALIYSVAFAASPAFAEPPSAGTYTNEEEVYFDKEAKREAAPWIGIVVDATGKVAFVDSFNKPTAAIAYSSLAQAEMPGRVRMTLSSGRVSELRRARTATCWGAALKAAKKPDGTDDWHGARDIKLHDQGGRVSFGGGNTGARLATLRVRNVIWPSGPSRPSLVLYIHTPEGGERAISYSWADKDAKMIGINLRDQLQLG